jgi:hypothetical protein
MSVDIEVRGLKDVLKAIDKLDPKLQKKNLQKATADAAKKVLKPKVKADTPWPSMKRAVRAGAAKKEKPAGIVKYDPKRAWYRHILVGGSKAHSTKARRAGGVQAFDDGGTKKFSRGHDVRGIKANPVITRVADQYGDDALDHVERFLSRAFGLDD